MRVEEEKESRNHRWQSLGDGGCKSIDGLGNGRVSFVSGSLRLMKGVGGGRNDGRTRVKEDGRRAQS